MKILMLTCQYMPDVFGGAEKQCGRISKGLRNKGLEIQILTSRQQHKGKAKEVLNGVPVRRLYSPIAPDLLGRWLPFSAYWLLRVLVWGVFNHKQFDVIHCHQGKFGAFVGCCFARLFKKKISIKVGNSNQFMDFNALKAKKFVGPIMADFVLKTNPTVVAITDVIAQNCKDFGFNNIINIPNSIDTNLIDMQQYTEQPIQKANDVINLFYHGRLENIKKVDVLMESFALLVAEHTNIHFHLIGSGSVLASAKDYIKQQGLGSKVTFHGEVNDPVVFIQQFDVFVNASEAEGFSNSLLEALLAGKVLVSTPVSGASDAIYPGKNGYISDSFKAEDIKNSTIKGIQLHKQNTESVKHFSAQLIADNFTVEVIAEQYLALYKKLTGTNK
ncbi:glycosyltransferase family 4 protein [Psychromonas sp. 14N.309.X.WAT.B.A12]|uniref:glycosyltransferase family 4 protein n=1 Tax=Psychromonas sp. 14N.309.X.WAT.B.A12 TaxID=2998322 RepID=UPI0025B006FD|nr:glycosyltransferase family 4 protein [Psychromonas sp. 14N.309.X.WAT.B.A12]MDN2664228.1 glycosyltransferase family 4 protein [Psychromonas sp. 14N.309.X.WAT.B.A12]